MSSNSTRELDFITQASLFIAESHSLPIENAMSYVYNSDTFHTLETGGFNDKSVNELLDIFKNEISLGKSSSAAAE